MQSQEQPLALTAVTSLYSTNGKEEEVNTDAESMEEEVEFNWEEYMEETGANAAPHTTFKHVEVSLQSSFQPGMKLEVANKSSPDSYWVATIITTCGQLLLLRFSGYGDDRKADFWCDVMTAELHPVGWCTQNNKTLMPPEDNIYLRKGSELHASSFSSSSFTSTGSDLTAQLPCPLLHVTPLQLSTVFLKGSLLNTFAECSLNVTVGQKQKKIAVVQPEKPLAPSPVLEPTPVISCQPVAMDPGSANGRYCCSKIFVNHRCFSGPYLNKGRIAELPQAVGPGKCTLVLKELLSMLINAAYKPGRVLKELQDLEDQSWDCQEETLKAKYKGKTYRSTIRIVRLADQIADFCRKVCVKLQCCPNLFSPLLIADKCPENCSVQTKTKYTYYYGKKRKLSKPMAGEEATEAKPTRRRKKRKAIFVQKKRRSSNVDYTAAGSPQDSEEDEEMTLQSGSEGTSSEPREDHPDGSSAEVNSSRPRRAASLRRAFSTGEAAGGTEAPEGRRRSTRSLSTYNQNKYQPPEGQDMQMDEEEDQLVLDRNPLEWSVDEVVQFINSTDCASLANIFQEQDIDGQALLLLTLPTVQECMDLKLGPAIKLCHQIERVKVAFYRQFAN
ncbi:scm-like with four MBT domains protein 2 [Notothenia coriiceps]|uniref:Scm-like with four MBT domains protein 2 n=1 Tax=Notothenia coriiceps TaxID=8208 RepID=A0A6I9NT42_9TELE|nr:PREDICTED: scm-like with four MBT domains protein 2 [Notothenia coriiceps]